MSLIAFFATTIFFQSLQASRVPPAEPWDALREGTPYLAGASASTSHRAAASLQVQVLLRAESVGPYSDWRPSELTSRPLWDACQCITVQAMVPAMKQCPLMSCLVHTAVQGVHFQACSALIFTPLSCFLLCQRQELVGQQRWNASRSQSTCQPVQLQPARDY